MMDAIVLTTRRWMSEARGDIFVYFEQARVRRLVVMMVMGLLMLGIESRKLIQTDILYNKYLLKYFGPRLRPGPL